MQKCRRGFTLVELLVVVIIVCILATLFFPMFSSHRARGNAYRSSCQSNLKQMALGVKQYIQDYNHKYPNSGVLSPSRDDGWGRVLQFYVRGYQVFQCPFVDWKQDTAAGSVLVTEYYYNGRLARVSEANLSYMSHTILFGDGESASSNYACSAFDHCIGSSLNGPVTRVTEAAKLRHLEGANYAFADGHVKWVKPVAIKPVTKHSVYGFTTG